MIDNGLKDHVYSLNHMLGMMAQEAASSQALLDSLAQYCVDEFGAAFARIWLIDDSGATLHLKSSCGQYTRIDGTRSRIPIGQGSKIDKMFVEGVPHVTNDVLSDPGVKDKEWAKRERFASFAGYPLLWNSTKLGVLGMYSREPLSEELLSVMGIFSFVTSAFVFQQKQYEQNMSSFCEVTGFKPALLARLIKLGRVESEIKR